MNYVEISKEAVGHLYQSHRSLRKSVLDIKLIMLAELRVSQLNGCAYCCGFHAAELRESGISQALLDVLPGWKLSAAFDAKQRLVLQWAESVTLLQNDIPDHLEQLKVLFSSEELVDLTTSISLMNALNRLRITLADKETI